MGYTDKNANFARNVGLVNMELGSCIFLLRAQVARGIFLLSSTPATVNLILLKKL